MPGHLHPTDAQTYWMSTKIPNDQFLLYCFDTDASAETVVAELVDTAREIPDLNIRIADVPLSLSYPRLRTMRVEAAHVRLHGRSMAWSDCTDAIAALFANQLQPGETPWQVHLFDAVENAPRCDGPSLVAVLQISHALGDGRVVSSLARLLFGDDRQGPIHAARASRPGPREFFRRARRANAAARTLVEDTEAGRVPPQAPGRTKTRVNVAPTGPTTIRTVVRDRSDLTRPGTSVTVGALTVVSVALSRYLELHGDEVPADLGAEVTLGRSDDRRARNHFRNAGLGLFPDVADLGERRRLISHSMADRLARARHPAMHDQSMAAESVPAVLLRWGIRQFDATAVPDSVTGNTVVSSVDRGDGELLLGGGRVRFTAGFPGLSPVMGLTHGVHGIGETVTLSITSAASAIPDPDVYVSLVHDAVDEVSAALEG